MHWPIRLHSWFTVGYPTAVDDSFSISRRWLAFRCIFYGRRTNSGFMETSISRETAHWFPSPLDPLMVRNHIESVQKTLNLIKRGPTISQLTCLSYHSCSLGKRTLCSTSRARKSLILASAHFSNRIVKDHVPSRQFQSLPRQDHPREYLSFPY